MIRRSSMRVWIRIADGTYRPLAASVTHLQEVCKTTVLKTPDFFSPFCRQEILHHTVCLEFEGMYDPDDEAMSYLRSLYLKQGDEARVTLVTAHEGDRLTYGVKANRVTGYAVISNPGSGESVFTSPIRGTILYDSLPEKGVFYDDQKRFVSGT